MGAAPNAAYYAIPNLHRPYVYGVGAPFPQTLGCGQKIVRDGPTSAGNVYGDELTMMVSLNPEPDVPFVNLVSQAGCLFTRAA